MFLLVGTTFFIFFIVICLLTKTGTFEFLCLPCKVSYQHHSTFIWFLASSSLAFFFSPAYIFSFPIIVISTNFIKDQDISFTLTAFEELVKANHSAVKQHRRADCLCIFRSCVLYFSGKRKDENGECFLPSISPLS